MGKMRWNHSDFQQPGPCFRHFPPLTLLISQVQVISSCLDAGANCARNQVQAS
jgi:hypothetical protein